jgi:hypothetical protein
VKAEIAIELRNLQELLDLTNEIRQLSDLVPEWNRMEAKEHEENIEELLFELMRDHVNN